MPNWPHELLPIFFFQAEDGIRDLTVTGVQTCALPISYDSARAVFRAAKRLDVGALICEIARSEIGYTEQRPAEYVAVMTAAALREGFTGPLFIQGDHVQVNAKKYAVDAETELQAIRTLIEEELHAGFYNIDVDTSTLVDLSQPTLDAQQRVNYERAADLTKFILDQE